MDGALEMKGDPLSVDEWVEKLRNIGNIGEMTHWERMQKAFDLEEPDMVPVAPEADYWPCYHQGYTSWEIFEGPGNVAKRTHALIKTWMEFRWDAIWQYVDISEELDPLIPPEKRKDHYVIRGPRDYVVFKPAATTLDDAIRLFQERVWERYGSGHAEYFVEHCRQLLEFQRKMNNMVPVITGAATPSNHAETVVEVQRFIKWTVKEPKQKMHDYMDLVLQERLEALDTYRDFAAKNGCEFFCCWGGGRTWGPRQWSEFGEYDELFLEKVRRIFKNPFWHICGRNLKEALTWLARSAQGIKAVQYDTPLSQYNMSWPEWYEWVAKLFKGRRCAMNSPTTQLILHGTPEEVKDMVKTFIKYTAPYTTPVVMPPCELSGYTPVENIKAMIEAARTYGKYPIRI
ncbi:MAG: uroporphyrinogen decarboxylase family protein [Candidatus Bathyarchaeia archaeon]